MPKYVTNITGVVRGLVQGANSTLIINGKEIEPSRPIPRETRYECVECGWQGRFADLDDWQCPECGGDVEKIEEA